MTAEFNAWFTEQFGHRPSMPKANDTDLLVYIQKGHRAKTIRNQQREYDAKKDAALKAWEATSYYENQT